MVEEAPSGKSECGDKACVKTLTTVSMFGFGVKTILLVPAAETLAPKVPNPDEVTTFPYSVTNASKGSIDVESI